MSKRLSTFLFFVSILVFFLAIQLPANGFGDPDGYFHVKMAQMLAQGQPTPGVFPWLSATVWAQRFSDMHWLYHWMLAPFVKIDPIKGAQIFNVLTAFAAICALYGILKFLKTSSPKIWIWFLLLGSSGFLLRINLLKASGISLFFTLMAIYFLLAKKPFWLAALCFIFPLTYEGFVFLPALIALYILAAAIKKIFSENAPAEKPMPWKNIFWPVIPALALIPGVFLHPYPFNMLSHLIERGSAAAAFGYAVPVGAEWRPMDPYNLMALGGLVFPFWLAAFFVFIQNFKEWLKFQTGLFLAFVSVFLWLSAFKSMRFIEYAAPAAIIFSALIFYPATKKIDLRAIIGPILQKWKARLPIILGVSCLTLTLFVKTLETVSYFWEIKNINQYKNVSEYLINNSAPGEIVFNTEWDQFPMFFYYNSRNRYIVGMDPMFMYQAGKESYWLWRHISDDQLMSCPETECDPTRPNTANIYDTLTEKFDASYLAMDNNKQPNLKRYLESQKKFQTVFSDEKTTLFKLL